MNYYHHNYPMIDLLRLLDQLRSNRTNKTFTPAQIKSYCEILTFIMDQLEFPHWSKRFRKNGLDKYFFQTIGIVITPNKDAILTTINVLQSNNESLNVSLKLRGLETLINETVCSLSKKQINELNTLLTSLLGSTEVTK